MVFFEYDHKPGNYCLMLSDDKMLATQEVFAAAGYEGGGYDWAGVARSAVHARLPESADRIRFDPEAGMFVAYGADPDALRALGAILRDAVHDHELLAEFIRTGDPDWFD
nr:immunity 51 family protein [Nocardia bovistercoris]